MDVAKSVRLPPATSRTGAPPAGVPASMPRMPKVPPLRGRLPGQAHCAAASQSRPG
jgi:hypothetical protein